MKLFVLILLFVSLNCHSQLSGKRQFQLDSIVSTIPVDLKKNAAGVHKYLDSLGKSDEEKVWMFYGFIGTFLKYDHKRMNDLKSPDYSPYTTVKKGSGVCRDFSNLFDFFCGRSKIPCYRILGKCNVSFKYKMNRFLHGYSNATNHQWNIVKVNGKWQLMDPTWSSVESVKTIPIYDKRGTIIKKLKIKSISRKYYDSNPEFMARSHAPINPAFYLLSKVPEFRPALRKRNKKYYSENFEFTQFLDHGTNKEFEEINRVYDSLSMAYSKEKGAFYFFDTNLNEPLLKRTEYNPFNLESYKQDSVSRLQLYEYCKSEFNRDYLHNYIQFVESHRKLKEKFIKAEAKKKKR